MNFISKILRQKNQRYDLKQTGFHGDKYLINLVDFLVKDGVEVFIETGTNVGSTLSYFARKYPQISCYSCEPDDKAYAQAKRNTDGMENIELYNQLSQDFMLTLEAKHKSIFEKKCLLWIDAHSYGFRWPLQEEISFFSKNIKQGYMLIDDFLVPEKPQFQYDRFEDQLCAHSYIENYLNKDYELFYPSYTKKTSKHHPLVGWGLYIIGDKPEGLHNLEVSKA